MLPRRGIKSGGVRGFFRLRARLNGGPSEVRSPNAKVVSSPSGFFIYPDVVVICGEPQFHDERRDTLLNRVTSSA